MTFAKELKDGTKGLKVYLAKWWVWLLLMAFIAVPVGVAMKYMGVFGERKIFEQSYQYKAARKAEVATFEAQLVEINRQLDRINLTEETRSNLGAQAAGLRVKLGTARRLQ